MLWWVFNDLDTHGETKGRPLGVEVHGSCYAYYYRDLPPSDSNAIVNRTILFDYKIINRSGNDYDNFYTGIWNDVDLGNYADDYVGCDTLQNSGFGYNGDNYDEGEYGYGKNPPVIFCKLLNRKMSSFVFYQNSLDPQNGNPQKDSGYYNYMQAKILNGGSMPKFQYSGRICDTSIRKNISPGDRRFLMSTNIPSLKKDSILDIEFAYILLHDPNIDFLKEGCDKPSQTLARIQNWYDNNSFPSRPYYGTSVETIEDKKNAFMIYPNPANTLLNLRSDIENKDIKGIEIFDSNGKLVYQSKPDKTYGIFATTIDIRSLSSGIYVVKIIKNNGVMVEKLIKE
jgi:hypothetical protein